MLDRLFGEKKHEVISKFLSKKGDCFVFKSKYDSQAKINQKITIEPSDTIEERSWKDRLKSSLYHLHSEVLFFVDEQSAKHLHPRAFFQDTQSFQELDGHSKHKLEMLHNEYFLVETRTYGVNVHCKTYLHS